MLRTTSQDGTKDNKRKRVRFNDMVKTIEIERIDMTKETNEAAAKTNSDGYVIALDERSDTRTSTNTVLRYSFLPSCSSAQSTRYRRSLVGPDNRKLPTNIPSMLFQSRPAQTTMGSSLTPLISSKSDRQRKRSDRRQQRSRTFKSSLSPLAPIRAPSIDEIIDCALAIVEEESPSTPRRNSENRSVEVGQQNHVWNDCDFVRTAGGKRWTEGSHTPPKIPRRKVSANSLKKFMYK